MRIGSGSLRGRTIKAPHGETTRPTSDRAREGIFNVLKHAHWAPSLEGAHIADLFAGSGALGIEALSHAAQSCDFYENSKDGVLALKHNIEALGLSQKARIFGQDATQLPIEGAAYDIVFMDPPYFSGLGEQCLERFSLGQRLSKNAIIVFERNRSEGIFTSSLWEVCNRKIYGIAEVLFLSLKIHEA